MSTNASASSSSTGLGFTGALTILFIALKLTGVIDWSWWWVLSPLWIGWGIFALIAAGLGIAFLVLRNRRRRGGRR